MSFCCFVSLYLAVNTNIIDCREKSIIKFKSTRKQIKKKKTHLTKKKNDLQYPLGTEADMVMIFVAGVGVAALVVGELE